MPKLHPEVADALVMEQDLFAWEVPSHARHERGPRWYVLMSLAAIILVAYAVWTSNFGFAFLILLMAIILVLAGNEEPRKVLVQIGDNGVVWNGRLSLFQDFDHFAIVYQPPMAKVLYLEYKNPLIPRLRIPLEDEDPLALREHLRQYLREDLDLQHEHLSDSVARLLKI